MAHMGQEDSMMYSKKLASRRQCLNFEECQMIALVDEYCGHCKKKYWLTGLGREESKKKMQRIKPTL